MRHPVIHCGCPASHPAPGELVEVADRPDSPEFRTIKISIFRFSNFENYFSILDILRNILQYLQHFPTFWVIFLQIFEISRSWWPNFGQKKNRYEKIDNFLKSASLSRIEVAGLQRSQRLRSPNSNLVFSLYRAYTAPLPKSVVFIRFRVHEHPRPPAQ